MKLTLVPGALALALAALPALVRAQGSIVDTQLEVSTALVQSSLTVEAIKKADDARNRALMVRIDTLAAQVMAGKVQKAELVTAKEALIAQLSQSDTAYRAEIAAFRGAVTDVASTPGGLLALGR